MRFDIFIRRGRNWSFVTTVTATDSRTAARQYRRHHTSTTRVAVRPSDTVVRPFVYTFNRSVNHATDLH